MGKTRLNRHKHYVSWQLSAPLPTSDYRAEQALIDAIQRTNSELFRTCSLPFTEDNDYHYTLSFLLEAIDLLPLHIDLTFDTMWRAFESLFINHYPFSGNGISITTKTPEFAECLSSNSGYIPNLERLLQNIPFQSCEYLGSRIFDEWAHPITSCSNRVLRRIRSMSEDNSIKLPTIIPALKDIAQKYGCPNHDLQKHRKLSGLIRLLIQGQSVEILGHTYLMTLKERIALIIGGMLYTFRNDRFHANVQPPFKSTRATLKTYTHAHYCMIFTHSILLFALVEICGAFKHDPVIQNIEHNTDLLIDLYGKHVEK